MDNELEKIEYRGYQELALVGDEHQKTLAWNLWVLEQELNPTVSKDELMSLKSKLFPDSV